MCLLVCSVLHQMYLQCRCSSLYIRSFRSMWMSLVIWCQLVFPFRLQSLLPICQFHRLVNVLSIVLCYHELLIHQLVFSLFISLLYLLISMWTCFYHVLLFQSQTSYHLSNLLQSFAAALFKPTLVARASPSRARAAWSWCEAFIYHTLPSHSGMIPSRDLLMDWSCKSSLNVGTFTLCSWQNV